MKTIFLPLSLLAGAGLSHGATAYWSFQNAAGSVFSTSPAYVSGFATAPTFTAIQGNASSTGNHGSGLAYTEPTTSTSYVAGYAAYWDTGLTTTYNLGGAGFIIGLDMTGQSNLSMRFDIRSAAASSTDKVGLPTSFSAINYRAKGSTTWLSSGITPTSSWSVDPSNFYSFQMSLAALDQKLAADGISDIELQFIFNGGPKGIAQAQNLRLDNLQFTTVPEPSAAVLLSSAAGLAFLRRRK